jgi:hypothetical protein
MKKAGEGRLIERGRSPLSSLTSPSQTGFSIILIFFCWRGDKGVRLKD